MTTYTIEETEPGCFDVVKREPGCHADRVAKGLNRADAARFAASADLLAVCEQVWHAFGLAQTLPLGFPPDLADNLRAAIAKAKGQ